MFKNFRFISTCNQKKNVYMMQSTSKSWFLLSFHNRLNLPRFFLSGLTKWNVIFLHSIFGFFFHKCLNCLRLLHSIPSMIVCLYGITYLQYVLEFYILFPFFFDAVFINKYLNSSIHFTKTLPVIHTLNRVVMCKPHF